VINTNRHTPAFADRRWAARACDLLLERSRIEGFDLEAYCVMPDHVHILIAGETEQPTDLQRFVRIYKQRLGYEYKQATSAQLWQRSYFDHVLRPDERVDAHATYILSNPVAAGLAELAGEWPYSGPAHMLDVAASLDRSKDLSLRLAEVSRIIDPVAAAVSTPPGER
jgi:putative transposase